MHRGIILDNRVSFNAKNRKEDTASIGDPQHLAPLLKTYNSLNIHLKFALCTTLIRLIFTYGAQIWNRTVKKKEDTANTVIESKYHTGCTPQIYTIHYINKINIYVRGANMKHKD